MARVNLGFSSHSHLWVSPSVVVKPGHYWGAHSTFVWQVTPSTEVIAPSGPRSHPGKPAKPSWQIRERNCLPAPRTVSWQPDQLEQIGFIMGLSDKSDKYQNKGHFWHTYCSFQSTLYQGRTVPLRIPNRSFRRDQALKKFCENDKRLYSHCPIITKGAWSRIWRAEFVIIG